MRILTAEEVRRALPMPAAIEAVRAAYRALSAGEIQAPIRGALPVADGLLLSMPAYASGASISAVKLVSVYGQNPTRGLAAIHGVVVVFDATTGQPRALLEASSLTAIRTGAGSGVATDCLARADARVLALLGAGAQAPAQAAAVCAVRPIEEIRVYSPNHAARFLADWRAEYDGGPRLVLARDAAEALAGADVVCAATNSHRPVFALEDLAPGAHINGIGSFTPQMQEISAAVVSAAKVVVDHRESAWEEAGDLIIPRDAGQFAEGDIHAEIGEIIAGEARGRESDDELTFFKSVGHAAQDAFSAASIVARAEAEGLGREIPF